MKNQLGFHDQTNARVLKENDRGWQMEAVEVNPGENSGQFSTREQRNGVLQTVC